MPLSFFSSEAAALVAVVGVVVSMLILLEALDQLFLAHMTCAITTLFFLSLHLIWMYIFFEMSLIPVVLILASFGGQPEKTGAYLYLLCYSILSSFPMLLFFLSGDSEETDPTSTMSGVWAFCMTVMFLVKLPIYGLHMWLPKAHVEAPTTGSILLAGLLLKMGGWGLFRLAACGLGLLRSGVFLLGIAGMGMGGLLASFQTDTKSLVAYSSVGHMNFFCVILVDETTYGKGVSILMMFAHSLVSSLMFFLAGFLAHIICTRSMYYAGAMPVISVTMSLVMLVAVFANFGTPPSMSFFAEVGFLASILGSFPNAWVMMMAAFFLGCYFSVYFYLSLSSDNRMGGSRSSHNESLTLVVLIWIVSVWWSRGLI